MRRDDFWGSSTSLYVSFPSLWYDDKSHRREEMTDQSGMTPIQDMVEKRTAHCMGEPKPDPLPRSSLDGIDEGSALITVKKKPEVASRLQGDCGDALDPRWHAELHSGAATRPCM
jgi:hypothetical protein